MPSDGALQLELAGESVTLDPRRALVWPAHQTLIIADPHIGKGDRFRRAGIPVPASAAEADFARLTSLLMDYTATRLIILGDFLHARIDADDHCVDLMRHWRKQHAALEVLIVRGNHDEHAGPPPSDLGFISVDEPLIDGPFAYRHFPLPHAAAGAGLFTLAGHLHPGVTVTLGGGSVKRVPCCQVTSSQAILPAFSAFTGTGRIDVNAAGAVYAFGRDRVIALPRPAMV